MKMNAEANFQGSIHADEPTQKLAETFDALATGRAGWLERNAYFYEEDVRYMRFLVPDGQRVLEVGCGIGQLLAALNPSRGVGIDLSRNMIEQAQSRHPELEFRIGDAGDAETFSSLGETFDVIVVSDTVGLLRDCETVMRNLQAVCTPETRIIIAYYSRYWEPLLRLGEKLGLKMPQAAEQNWLSTDGISSLLRLADFETIKREWRVLAPRRWLGIGRFINRFIAPFAIIRRFCLRNYIVARPAPRLQDWRPSTTVLVPCRNEKGNVEAAVLRTPEFCDDLEILFVEGGSSDGTMEEIERVIAAHPERNVRVIQQTKRGKGNAVREGFAAAQGEVLMILDGDLTVPPEDLPKFYRALTEGKGEFVNGTRLVYPMEADAMRFLNSVANQLFSFVFTWLLNQRFTDTLCGTKVLTKRSYERIAANRSFFGDFDPFGDFDLIFGAAKQNLKIVEVPVRYAARVYGETQISRFRHGVLLFQMVWFAFRRLKAL